MDLKYFVISFLSFLSIVQAEKHINCVIEDNIRVRTFQTLVEYQANKLSFNPHDLNYNGNSISFDFDSIDRIPKNAFISFTSQNVIELTLKNKSINKIDEGAFISLFCLHTLDLSGNQISNLTKNMFLGLENLRTLNMSGNRLAYLYDGIFSKLKSIQILDISCNKLRELDKSALYNISTLEKLILSKNLMKRVRYPYFTQLTNLKELYLDGNSIALMPIIIFSKNKFLETVDLSGNGLVLLDIDTDQSVLPLLKNLNLSDNYLITLHVDSIKYHFPNDELIIDFNNNQFYCSSWKQYLKQFEKSHIKIVPGRNFSQNYYIDGIACDTLNVSGNANNSEEDTEALNAELEEKEHQYGKEFNNTFKYILQELKNKKKELSGKQALDTSVASDKLPLVEDRDLTKPSNIVNESNSSTIKGVTIGLAVIGTAFVIFVTIDYVLGIGFTPRFTRRLRGFWTRSNTSNDVEYLTLSSPS